jgi:integrase
MARKRLRSNSDLPDNLYRYGRNNAYFRYRHPETGDYHPMGTDKVRAVAAAKKLNHILVKPCDLVKDVLSASESSVAACIDRYIAERQPVEDMKPSTLKLENYRLDAMRKGLGYLLANDVSVKHCAEWLDGFQGNAYTKHRGTLTKVFAFAVAKGMMTENVALQTLTAPKLGNEKKRKPLNKEWFDLIYQTAPEWLQIAMQFALITLQRRGDIVKVQYSDIVDDHLHVVQEKTEKHGHRAFLAIEIGDSLQALLNQSKTVTPTNCPFVIHRLPARRIPFEGQQHHGQISGEYLGKAFSKARDQHEVFKNMPAQQRPTFHEIRALGGALYLEQGFSKEYVNLLMGHTSQKMTDDYTDRHQQWTSCAADLDINQ